MLLLAVFCLVVSVVGTAGQTPLSLIEAARRGDNKAVSDLLTQGVPVDSVIQNVELKAAFEGLNECFTKIKSKLCEVSAEVKETDEWKDLKWASSSGIPDAIHTLLVYNATKDIQHRFGWASSLLDECYNDIEYSLTESNFTMNMRDKFGIRLFRLVDGKTEIFITLRQHRHMRYRHKSSGDKTALMWAARYGNKEVVTTLLEYNAAVDIQSGEGWTALMWAARNGHSDIASKLIENDANVDMQDEYKATALMWAANNGQKNVVNLLLNYNASVNIQDYYGWTALMYAASYGYSEIVSALLEHGAAVDIQDEDGRTALIKAVNGLTLTVVEELIQEISNNDVQGLLRAANSYGRTDVVSNLLNYYGSEDQLSDYEYAALIWATDNVSKTPKSVKLRESSEWMSTLKKNVEVGITEVVQSLLNFNATIDLQGEDQEGSGSGSLQMLSILLVNSAKNNVGWTALMMASQEGQLEVVKTLLGHGASLDTKSNQGKTAKLITQEEGNTEDVSALLEYK